MFISFITQRDCKVTLKLINKKEEINKFKFVIIYSQLSLNIYQKTSVNMIDTVL